MADGEVRIKIDADGSQAAEEFDWIGASVEGLGDKADDASKKTEELGDEADNAGEKVGQLGEQSDSSAVGVLALGAALVGVARELHEAAQAAVAASTEFESAFAKTQTIMDSTVVSTDEMRAAILELSETTGMAATEVSEAVYQAISGSVDTADAVSFVNQANMLAVAGFTSLTNATDIMTTALNAYGLEADKVVGISNVLIQTQNLGKTSVDELSSTIGKAIATGSAYGVNLENISTAYVELTRNGIATAEATTYLSSMLNELGDSGSKVGTILQEKTGQTFAQLMAQGYTLGDVMQILSDSVNGSAEALMGLWSSQEAGKASNAIMTQGIADFNSVVAQMAAEMSGATGTTQAAYETMTSTSEYIDTRFKNSLTNLGIAVGDQLTPGLNAVKSALTSILEGLTGVVNSSPLAVSLFSALTTAVTLLAAGYAIYTAGALLAEKATIALTAAMDTNPILLAITAIAALGVGIATFVSNMESATAEVQAFRDELDQIEQTKDDTITSIEATANTVDYYIGRLEELEAAGLDTAEAQQEYHSILVLLTETVPELAGLINLETDSINGGTNALRANTAAWRENATAQAYQQYLSGYYTAQADAMIELQEATLNLNKAEVERDRIVNEMTVRQTAAEHLLGDEYLINKQRLAELDVAYTQAERAVHDYSDKVDIATQKVDAANDAVAHAEEVVNSAADATREGSDAVEQFGNAWGDTESQLSTAAGTIRGNINDIAGDLGNLQTAYNSAYNAALSSISGQFDLWDQIDNTAATSVTDIASAIQSQIDYWNNYNENVATLLTSGIHGIEAFVAATDNGSQKMAGVYQGMVNALNGLDGATAEDVQSIIDSWQELPDVYQDSAKSMADATTRFAESCEAIREKMHELIESLDISEDAKEAAKASVDAYIDGVEDGTVDATNAGNDLTQAAIDGMTGADASNAGANLALSYIQAIIAMEKDARNAASRVAAAAASGFEGGNQYNTSIDQAYASGTSYAASGYAIVGEEGPELIYLRGGERILTAEETRSVLQSAYISPDSYGGSVGGTGTVGGSAQMQATITVPVSIDGREVAKATASYMGEEMEFEVL